MALPINVSTLSSLDVLLSRIGLYPLFAAAPLFTRLLFGNGPRRSVRHTQAFQFTTKHGIFDGRTCSGFVSRSVKREVLRVKWWFYAFKPGFLLLLYPTACLVP